jgi:hypothetical protein
MNYTTQFAETQYIPFSKSPSKNGIRELILNPNSTIQEWLGQDQNWLSQTTRKYSQQEMESLWGVIEYQKKTIQKKYDSKPIG